MQYSVIESPISDLKLDAIGVSREKMLERITSAMRFAAEHGIHAAFFGVDSTRADPAFYRQVYESRGRGRREGGRRRRHARHRLAGGGRPTSSARRSQWVDGVPVHFHGHNDFGLATASRRRRGARRARRTCTGRSTAWASAPGNANLGEVALDAARALRRRDEPAPRPDPRRLGARARAVGLRARAVEAGHRRDALPPRVGRGRVPVPRPAVDRAVLLRARREPSAGSCSARRAASTRSASRPTSSASTCPRTRRAEVLAAVKELGTQKRGLVTDDEFRAIAVAEHDAVVVGSGVNGLACAALLAKAGWDVCVLERNDWFGGAIRTAEITEPGFRHDVFSAWHPLWVGGPVHAQLGGTSPATGSSTSTPSYPTATAFPDGDERVPAAHGRRERGRARTGVGAVCSTRSSRTPTSRSAILGTELWSRHGAALGAEGGAPARPRRRARLRRAAARLGARLARVDVRVDARRTACSRRGCCTPASGPTRRPRATWRR